MDNAYHSSVAIRHSPKIESISFTFQAYFKDKVGLLRSLWSWEFKLYNECMLVSWVAVVKHEKKHEKIGGDPIFTDSYVIK